MRNRLRTATLALFVAALALCLTATVSLAQTRVTIGATETMETHNPYGDSVALLYGIYTELAGPLCKYNWSNGSWEPRLAKSWKVIDPNNWVFELDQRYKFNDGSPVTAHDIVHSIWRIFNDPQSKQKASVARPVKEAKALSDFSVQITTHKPTAPLLDFLCDGLIITSKAAYDKYGPAEADRKHHMGGGPYELVELVQGQRMVIRKRPDHPAMSRNPDAPGRGRLPRHARDRAAGGGPHEQRGTGRAAHPAASDEDGGGLSEPQDREDPIPRDHVPGHAAQAALRQEGSAPSGVLRHRPGQDHQDPAARGRRHGSTGPWVPASWDTTRT